ncbi:hypothetical protein ACLIBG_10095 [Virgibacillus sp. W0181]|uniref:hypothetical protein n=1 Tax=Virgibacillus sp. W0181 TaxID=3391581 RepID=UPI003F464D0F
MEKRARMKRLITWGLRLSIGIFAVLHFFTSIIETELLEYILSISGLLLLVIAGLKHTVLKFKIPFFISLSGVLIIIFANGPIIEGIMHGILEMRSIIGLLIIVPLISWVLQEEPYVEDIMAFFHKLLNTSRKFYFGLVAFTQVIAYFLLFGSIPMMYQFVNIILKDKKGEVWENFKGTAILRGFALSSMWVISIPSFIFSVETLGASLWVAILQGFGMAMIGTVVAVIFSAFQEKSYGVQLTPALNTEINNVLEHASNVKVRKQKVIEFFLLFITLFGTIFLLHALLHVALMLIIPFVVILWTFSFYVYKGKMKKFFRIMVQYFNEDMTKQSYQLSVMVAVGLLIYGLNQTDFASVVVDGLYYTRDHLPFLNLLYLLPFIVIILGFFSLGPLTVMVLVTGILESMALPYPPELIVLAITSGSVITILLSPVVMPVIVLSGANGLGLFTNGVKFNIKYSIVFYVIVQVYIQTMIYFK